MYPTKKLWEVSKTTSWWTPLRSERKYWWWNIPWLKSGELNDNLKINSSEEFITELGLQNSSAKIFQKWTLLIALYGATAWKLWILDFDASTNQAVCSIQNIRNFFVEKYIFYFLLNCRKKIITDSTGWAQPNISKNYLDNLPIPLPPLSTQKLIVEKLDMIFAEIEKSKNLLEKNLQNVDEMNKSVLEKIFANDEWERKKLGEVCEIKKWKKVNYSEQWKYNYIDIGILRTNIIEQYTNDEWIFCNKNDILIAWDGSKSGTVGFWLEWVIGSTLAKITIDTKMFSSEFIGKFLQGNFDYLNKNTSGAAIPHLRKDILINLEIPLPPLETQKNIVSYLDNIFAENQKLKNLYQAQIKNLDEMKQSFLKKAFAGELV